MNFLIKIPTHNSTEEITVNSGESIIFIGANGTGKTRLATLIEEENGLQAHRIAAHRTLNLNPRVPKISESLALKGLLTGYADQNADLAHRTSSRWQYQQAAVSLLDDFDYLIQALFAEQANTALQSHQKLRNNDRNEAVPTKFEILTDIWERLLPHRKLHISGDDIQVSSINDDNKYSASDMSDGERSIFYILGQVIVAPTNSLLIFDEPELHIHPSILTNLWDEVEVIRPDCAFIFITHDLNFASSRIAKKFVLNTYNPAPYWAIKEVPIDSYFDEELITLILGSRMPILFVEGSSNSFDIAIYRNCFIDWMVIPKGSCEEVIHSVNSLRNNDNFTRISCTGIIDADGRTQEEKDYLKNIGIATLPVSEIENLILMPNVSKAIAESSGYSGQELEDKLEELKNKIFGTLSDKDAIEEVVARYCRRRIDRLLKKIDLSSADTVSDIKALYNQKMEALDIEQIAQELRLQIKKAITDKNLPLLLQHYDNKGLLNLSAITLKSSRLQDFKSWLVRILRNGKEPNITAALKELLPDLHTFKNSDKSEL